MRLSTIFISSAFVLAGMSAALPIEKENLLVARFADSDFLGELEARAYDEELGLYARGSVVSKEPKEHDRASRPPSHHSTSSRTSSYRTERPPAPPPSRVDSDLDSHRPPSPFTIAEQRNQMGSGVTSTHFHTSPNRRSFYETPRDELTRRGVRAWVKNGYSKVTGFFGGSSTQAQPMGDYQ